MPSINRRDLLGRACSLGSLALGTPRADDAPRRRKVVVAGGHPGDPEYGCGGTVARYADLGHEVVLLYLNDGVPAGTPKDGVRVAEAGKACEVLNARSRFAGQVDGDAIVDRAHYEAFGKLLAAERPDVVFAHWPIDNHADRRAVAMLAYDAWLRLGRRFAVPRSRRPLRESARLRRQGPAGREAAVSRRPPRGLNPPGRLAIPPDLRS